MSSTQEDIGMERDDMDAAQPGGAGGAGAQPSEEEMRAAYEAELSRITAADMILQSAASLLNIGGLRLGLVPDIQVERDLEQVRDAIDGVRALLPIIERHGGVGPQSLRSLRDALAQLQMAYTRELSGGEGGAPAQGAAPAQGSAAQQAPGQPQPAAAGAKAPAGGQGTPDTPGGKPGPGPAESSGRLWVPGR